MINYFLQRAGILKKQNPLVYLKIVHFSIPRLKAQGDFFFFFSNICCGNLVQVLEANLTKLWGPSCDLEPLTLRAIYTEHPETRQLQFRFSFPGTGSCHIPSTPVSCDSLFSLVLLQSGHQWFSLYSSLFYGSESC